ncbi:hypothetical protein [Sporomusa acidovorans]|uniref:hypothetical protein n=1 Tax=Sporomusa acidovorans TaxID=112900 RepID=UPI00088AAE96|nr:hypothetical protein [Sporomusa acidovorans]OZC19045.1 hypothetical protein SPACI_31310 [Sporomusa acidovorans DSM 3132]SDD74038.1 hypothetical protein SAMN04488499_1003219 [Sporomusa acidovorans]
MADMEIRAFEAYDTKEKGKPWAAKVLDSGKLDFNIPFTYSGNTENGDAGVLYIKEAEPGRIYATGQKNYQTRESNIEYISYNGQNFDAVEKDVIVEMKDRYYAALPTERASKTQDNVEQQLERYKKYNEIVVVKEFGAYSTEKLGKPWVCEFTKDGIELNAVGNPEAKVVGRVVGQPGEFQQAFVVNPSPEQVFVVGQKDLQMNKHHLHFYRVENGRAVEMTRQEAENSVGYERKFRPFEVEDKGKVVLDMPKGYDPERYQMWVAKEIVENGKRTCKSGEQEGHFYGSYSGGREGKPGQFYINQPEENGIYVVWKKDIAENQTEMAARMKYANGQMHEQPILQFARDKVVLKEMPGFDEERLANPSVALVRQDGSFSFMNGTNAYGHPQRVGGYTGRNGLGEAGSLFVYEPKEDMVFAVVQENYQTLRTQVSYYQYQKGNFIEVDRETAKELAAAQPRVEATVKQPEKELEEIVEKLKNGQVSPEEKTQIKERLKEIQAEMKKEEKEIDRSLAGARGKGKSLVIASVAAYDAKEFKLPYIMMQNEKDRMSFVQDKNIAEFKGSAKEGGQIVLHDAKEGTVVAYGQARVDGTKTQSRYALVLDNKVQEISQAQYRVYKKDPASLIKPKEQEYTSLSHAADSLAAKGITGPILEKKLAVLDLPEFKGKSVIEKAKAIQETIQTCERTKEPHILAR